MTATATTPTAVGVSKVSEGNGEASSTPFSLGPDSSSPSKHTEPPKYNLTLDQLATYAFYAFLVWLLLLFKIFRPSIWTMLWYMVLGTGGGVAATFMYFAQLKRKEELRQVLSFDPGLKGMKFLCGELPSWLSLTEREKVNWLNNLLKELWPFYDKAVCDMVKQVVEPIMDQYKPKGLIKRITFKNLTFGTAPFRIEDMLVMEDNEDEVLLEVNIRWAGDANITMAVDLPAGGEMTRLCPKVTDLSFMGTARISLRPLIDTIPCFGFAMVSFRRPPLIKYHLDFGRALGGSTTANGIKGFIDDIVQNQLINMFEWPNRQLYPIVMNEHSARELAKLNLRDVGIMRIRLVEAKGLKAMDMNGKSDPTVSLWIDPRHRVTSKTVKATLNPQFNNEEFFLLVQEPKDQFLRLEMFDVDFFNAEKLASTWKVWNSVSSAFNAKTFMGRSMINVKHICHRENEEKGAWYPLGKGEWGDDEGPGRGEGEICLKCSYRSFASFSSLSGMSSKGVLVVQVFQCSKVELSKGQDFINVHMVLKLNKETYKSTVCRAYAIKEASGSLTSAGGTTNSKGLGGGFLGGLSMVRKPSVEHCNPQFTDAKHSFYDVDINSTTTVLKMKLITPGGLGTPDEELGRYQLVGPDIRDSRYQNQQGRMNRTVFLEDSGCRADIHFEVMFIPYF